jgi:hypothetical protein
MQEEDLMNRRTTLLIGLIAGLCALPAMASTFVAMETHELVAASEAVVQGKVLEVYSFWNADGTAVLTEARVLVEEVVAGKAGNEVVVRTFGGQVGDYRLEAHGFPVFRENDRVLLFLHTAPDRSLRVTGYMLGDYRVSPGARGELMARPTLEQGVRLLHADGRPAPAPKAVPLEAFKNQIRSLAAELPGRRPIAK